MITLQGNPASRGVAIGVALVYEPFQPAPWDDHISIGQVDTELQIYRHACGAAAEELKRISGQMAQAGDTKGAIFQAQRDLLDDDVIREEIEAAIQNELLPAAGAVERVYQTYAALLARTEDAQWDARRTMARLEILAAERYGYDYADSLRELRT